MNLTERARDYIANTKWTKELLEKSTPGVFLAILAAVVAAAGAISKALSLDKPIAVALTHAIVQNPATKELSLKGWAIASLLLIAAIISALLLLIIWVVKNSLAQSSEQLALDEVMGSVRQIRDQAKQVSLKAWDSMTLIYLINKDLSGSQVRIATIRATGTPVHFYESVNSVEDEADPIRSFSKINYRVRDLDSPKSNIVYLPSENGVRSKKTCLFFLPPIEPGKTRRFETSFQWSGMFNRLKKSWEDFECTIHSREVLPLYRMEVYLQEGSGRTLQCTITGDQYSTQKLTPSTYNMNGWGGSGYVYEVADIAAGIVNLVLRVELKS